jgi:8-oxo-dGTP diphosphatase
MELSVGAKGLVIHEGRMLLLRESKVYIDGTNIGKWDVPGGRIKPGESVFEGLIRETREESGIVVRFSGRILGVFDGFPEIQGKKCHVVRIYFLCEADSSEVTVSADHDAHVWVTPEERNKYHLVDDLEEVIACYMSAQ